MSRSTRAGHPGSPFRASPFRATPLGLRLAVSPNQLAPRARPASARRLVKDSCLREPGRLPSTSAPSTRSSRIVLPTNCFVNAQPARTGPRREPATVLAALPPRAGFRRSFATRSVEGGEARPAAVRRNGPSAARRLLQPKHSASTTARSPEPRFCSSGRLRFTDPPGGRDRRCNPSSKRALSLRPRPRWNRTSSTSKQLSPDLLLRVVLLLAERLQPRFHGPGTRGLSPARRLPSRLLAREASPRPDPLEHLVSRARRDAGRRSRRRGHMPREERVSITNPPDEPACAWLAERPACAGRPPVTHSAMPARADTSACALMPARAGPACAGSFVHYQPKGRLPRSSAKKIAIRRTRGAFHR